MASPTAPAPHGELVDYAQFVDDQMGRARRRIKSVEVLAAGTVLAAALLGYLLVMVILDHALPHGLPRQWRAISLVGLGAALAGFGGWFVVRPALRRINTLYAARTVERAEPRFKNSLITFLQLRDRSEVPEPILEAVEERAAADLARVRIETAVSQDHLVRGWYALAAVVVLCCLYIFVAPKSPFVSAGRVLFPYAEVLPPTKTQITEVRPGDDPEKSRAVAGANVEISGLVTGRMPDTVQLYWRTLDGEFPHEGTELARPESKYDRWKTTLRGVEQSFEYYLQGGDHRTKLYRVEVLPAPVAKVVSVSYRFPQYTGMPPLTVADGNISAWDGTEVTIEARASEPASRASLVLGNKNDERPMQVGRNPQELSVKLPLRLEDAAREENSTYRIWFTTTEGTRNPNPVAYELRIRPDNPPEVAIRRPGRDLDLPANALLPMELEAVDDFGIRALVLHATRGKEKLLDRDLRERQAPQREIRLPYTLDLAALRLSAGDQIEYWAEARDNRTPTPGVRESARYRVTLTSPVPEKERQEQMAQADQAQKKLNEEVERGQQEAEKRREGGEGERRQSPANEDQGQSRREGDPAGEPQQGAERQQDDSTRDRDAMRKLVDHFKRDRQPDNGQDNRSGAGEKPADAGQEEQPQDPKTSGQQHDPKRAETEKERPKDQQSAGGEAAKQGDKAGDPGTGDKAGGQSKQGQEHGDGKSGGRESSAAGRGGDKQQSQPAAQQGPKPGGKEQESDQKRGSAGGQESAKTNEAADKGAKGDSRSPSGRQDGDRPGDTAKKGESAGEQGHPGDTKSPAGRPEGDRPRGDASSGAEKTGDRPKADSPIRQQPGSGGKPDGTAADKRAGDATDRGEQQKPNDPGAGATKKDGTPRDLNAERGQGTEKGEPQPSDKTAGDASRGKPEGQKGTSQTGAKPAEPGGKSSDQRGAKPANQAGKTSNEGGAKPGDPSGQTSKAQGQQAKSESGQSGKPSADGSSQQPQPKAGGGEQPAAEKKGAGKSGGDKRQPGSGQAGRTEKTEPPGASGKRGEPPGKGQEKPSGTGQAGEKQQGGQADGKKEGAEGQAKSQDAQSKESSSGAGDEKSPAGVGDPQKKGGAAGQGAKPAGGQQAGGQQGGGQATGGAPPGSKPGGQGRGTGMTSPGKAGEKAPDEGRQAGGGKPGDNQAATRDADSTEPGGDPANPNYTREAAELVLERLGSQLDRGAVDPELLKKLGWTKEQLAQFVKRYRGKRDAIPLDDPRRADELAKTAQQLKLEKGTTARAPGKTKDDKRELSEAPETPPPPELKKAYDTYNRGLNRYRTLPPEK